MRLLHSALPLQSPPLLTSLSPIKASLLLPKKSSFNSHHRHLNHVLSNGFSLLLSLGLLVSAPIPTIALALESPSLQSPTSSLEVNCREDEAEEEDTEVVSKVVSNESIVEEAWQIVNDSFLNTSTRRSWSPESWLVRCCFYFYFIFLKKLMGFFCISILDSHLIECLVFCC